MTNNCGVEFLKIKMIPIDKIRPSPLQPRAMFDKDKIKELAGSIKEVGLIQPIVVNTSKKHGYTIIAGERRWRAMKKAGMKEVPAIVKNINYDQFLTQSLIENVHREDLSESEKYKALKKIMKLEKIPNLNQLAKRVKMSPTVVSDVFDAHEIRKKFNAIKNVSHTRIRATRGLSEKERFRLIKMSEKKGISARKLEEEVVPKIKKLPKKLRKSVISGELEAEVAEEIMKIEKPEIQEKMLKIAKRKTLTPFGIKMRIKQTEKKELEMPKESIGDQIYHKIMWNLERLKKDNVLDKFKFFTIGYGQRTIEQFVNILNIVGIHTLVDVRKNPFSKFKPEFNKKNLAKILKKNNIKYIHFPKLGVPIEARERLAVTEDYDWFFRWYDSQILSNRILESEDFQSLDYPIAIMCVELDPTRCHRHRIALALEDKGIEGLDL